MSWNRQGTSRNLPGSVAECLHAWRLVAEYGHSRIEPRRGALVVASNEEETSRQRTPESHRPTRPFQLHNKEAWLQIEPGHVASCLGKFRDAAAQVRTQLPGNPCRPQSGVVAATKSLEMQESRPVTGTGLGTGKAAHSAFTVILTS